MNSREFFFEYCNTINSIYAKYDEYARKFNVVSSNLFWLLYALNDGKQHRQLDLCEHCCLPKSTINTIIKDLEKKGYVILTKGEDKRERLVSYTISGKEYADSILNDLFSKEDNVFNENKDELMDLIKNLRRFNELLVSLESDE